MLPQTGTGADMWHIILGGALWMAGVWLLSIARARKGRKS